MRSLLKRFTGQRGQAAVELVAAAPVVALVALAGWQLVVAGHAWWKLGEASRISAREVFVARQRGEYAAGSRRSREIVRALIGPGVRSRVRADGSVSVTRSLPLVGPFTVLGGGPVVTRSAVFLR